MVSCIYFIPPEWCKTARKYNSAYEKGSEIMISKTCQKIFINFLDFELLKPTPNVGERIVKQQWNADVMCAHRCWPLYPSPQPSPLPLLIARSTRSSWVLSSPSELIYFSCPRSWSSGYLCVIINNMYLAVSWKVTALTTISSRGEAPLKQAILSCWGRWYQSLFGGAHLLALTTASWWHFSGE